MLDDAIAGIAGQANGEHVAALVAVRDTAGFIAVSLAAPSELSGELLEALDDFLNLHRETSEVDHAAH
jgi:hypothetical protein